MTVSPKRAPISTTRPVASEITGTAREMSGLTVPVTFSSGLAMMTGFERYTKKTERALFLEEMEHVVPPGTRYAR